MGFPTSDCGLTAMVMTCVCGGGEKEVKEVKDLSQATRQWICPVTP